MLILYYSILFYPRKDDLECLEVSFLSYWSDDENLCDEDGEYVTHDMQRRPSNKRYHVSSSCEFKCLFCTLN